MPRKIIDYYPDYLKDFDEIKKIADAQQMVENFFINEENSFLRKLTHSDDSSSRWDNIIDTYQLFFIEKEIKKLFHQMHAVMTINEFKEMIKCWIPQTDYTVEYDRENMKITVKTLDRDLGESCERRIRDFVPCNMDFEFQLVETLE